MLISYTEEMQIPDYKNEFLTLFIKIILPAIIAVGIKIAVQMKNSKVTVLSAVTSLVIGVGFAVLSAGVIRQSIPEVWQPVVIAVIAIVGEKIGYWLIYKFNFDKIGEAIINTLIKLIKK